MTVAVAGAGQGLASMGALRLVNSLAAPQQRAGVLASSAVVTYVGGGGAVIAVGLPANRVMSLTAAVAERGGGTAGRRPGHPARPAARVSVATDIAPNVAAHVTGPPTTPGRTMVHRGHRGQRRSRSEHDSIGRVNRISAIAGRSPSPPGAGGGLNTSGRPCET